ncbi:hypothetical protein RJT34_27802 [Clitoria ternatea]|uniref:Uncharacterized protein n=1 Tax=Clitoria ternatea TaxID=43366 RepID=A0AAN9FCZ6_CLITE
MSFTRRTAVSLVALMVVALSLTIIPSTNALIPYTRSSLFDMMLPSDDPFRILEQTPLNIPKGVETLALARADWKETPSSHVIVLDVPGLKKDDVKVEVEENRVVRISGERKEEEGVEGERWHRAERTNGKFWRQFRLPSNADLERVNARLQDGVLRITVPKVAEDKKRQPKVIDIAQQENAAQDVKATKAEV